MIRLAYRFRVGRFLCLVNASELGHTRNIHSCLKFNTWEDAVFALQDYIEAEGISLDDYEPEEVS